MKKAREEWEEPEIFEDMEYLYGRMIDLARQRGLESERPTKEELRRWVEHALLHEEVGRNPTTGSEDPTKG